MNHPLDGARLKIVRAQEHLDSLKAEIRMYLDEQPYRVVTKKYSNRITVLPEVHIQPPVRLSTIIGDCVANARAALDYVMWQLAIRYFEKPPLEPKADKRWVSFPIYRDTADEGYLSKINRFTNRAIPATAIDGIQSSQPNNAGYESLWWLHELVNSDKHRMPTLTLGQIGHTDIVMIDEFGVERNSINEERASMTLMTADPSIPLGDVQVDCQATPFVTFQDLTMPREPVDRTLEQIIETVTNVIPRFDRFF